MHDLPEWLINEATKRGASYAEARYEKVKASAFLLKNGEAELGHLDESEGVSVKLIAGGKAFFSTRTLTKDNCSRLLDNALRMAKKARVDIKLSEEQPVSIKWEVPAKKPIADMDVADKLSYLKDLDKLIVSKGDVPGRYFSLTDAHTEKLILTSDGGKVECVTPSVNMLYHMTVQVEEKTAQRFWQYAGSAGYELLDEWDLQQILSDEVTSMTRALTKGERPPQGKLDLVAAPQVVGIMCHESVGHPTEADRILGFEAAQAGKSFITQEKLDTRIGSDAITIVDDPTVSNSFGYYQADDECMPARRRYLYKQGIITDLLHNRETAALMDTTTTASARASAVDRESMVRMANTFLLEGDNSEEELIEGVSKGVFMRNFMEWNIDDSRLNQKYVGMDAWLIEDGELTKPLLNPSLEITTPQLWSSVDAVANNTEFHAGTCGKGEPMQAIPVWMGGPSMRLRQVMLK